MTAKLHQQFQLMRQQETIPIPREFKGAPSYTCISRRGIARPAITIEAYPCSPIAGKILARILLNRLTTHLDQTREPLWVPRRARDHRHGVCCKRNSRNSMLVSVPIGVLSVF